VSEIGLLTSGAALQIGSTEANVKAGGEQKHVIQEDDYGNTRFVRRVRKRELTATVWLSDDQGDYVDNIMSELEGRPVTWNFNNAGTTYERLLIHGWAKSWETVVSSIAGNDYLSISPLRGLAE
jgi:hypothetical protein